MKRLAFEFPGEPSIPEMARLGALAESLGYESVWLTETRFTRDAIVAAAAVAAATSRIGIGTAVVNPYTRGAVLTAVTFAGLDELSAGRIIAGVGPGSPTVLAQQGYSFERPLARLEESVAVIRRLLAGERVTFSGRVISVEDVELDFVPRRRSIPVYLGVTGPKALALAGRIADGVVFNAFVTTAYTRRATAIVRESALAAGRDPSAIDIAASIVVSVDADRDAARDAVRPLVATYLARFPNIAAESGLPTATLEEITRAYEDGGAQAASRAVPDEIVDDLTVCGSAPDCREMLAQRVAAGVGLPIVSPVGRDPETTLCAMAP